MVISNQLKNQHLLWRAGFGPQAEDLLQIQAASQETCWNALVEASGSSPERIDVADDYLKGLAMGMADEGKQLRRELSEEERKRVRKQNREDIKSLNLAWLDKMATGTMQFREKMSLFWHGHFACRNINILYQQQLLDVIRKNALGNFGDLLRAVSKTAAMINFLNNNQNRKGHPNENFAREVMELFTMGRGNYSEKDIKEAARAFTGWGANLRGEFIFRKLQHDDGTKVFLNKSGSFTGDDVLDILLEQPSTATFITRKIYTYFVNEAADEARIKWLSQRFFKSGYNILLLMKDIFTSDWFYEPRNIGTKIKSPVELLVGIRRMLPMEMENEEIQLVIQRILGQVLFYPPNVAGWPGGKSWIDSSSLMFRMRLPQLLTDNDAVVIKPKDDDDQMMGMNDKKNTEPGNKKALRKTGMQQIKADINWETYTKQFDRVGRENLEAELAKNLLQMPLAMNQKTLKKYADATSRESYIRTLTVQLMSTPEFQLC